MITNTASITREGQVAIVTGAARGIGAATARRLAADGISIVVVDLKDDAARDVVKGIENDGGSAVALAGDVTDPQLSLDAVKLARDTYGRLDILVNNAGVGSPMLNLWEMELEVFRRELEINLVSQFMMCKAAIPVMIEAGYGRILNVASAAGMEGHALSGGYASAKGGVVAMTKVLGKELAQKGVIVNAIAPALIGSGLLNEPWFDGKVKEQLLSRIPMGRVGEPEEVAEMISFLTSPAVTFSTGAVFDLSGGRATY